MLQLEFETENVTNMHSMNILCIFVCVWTERKRWSAEGLSLQPAVSPGIPPCTESNWEDLMRLSMPSKHYYFVDLI